MHNRTIGPRTGPSTMTPRELTAALGERAEPFCRRYLPHGHRQGRHWLVGDSHGVPGHSLWVCLAPPGHPGRWTDSATGQRGGPLELLHRCLGDAPPERVLAEARAFLATEGATPTMRRAPPRHELHHRAEAPIRLWKLCRSIHGSHAEAYLRARGLEHCGDHHALRFHRSLFHRGADDAQRELPALVAAVTDYAGRLTGVQRTYLDRQRPAKANVSHPRKALGRIHGCAVHLGSVDTIVVVAQGIETALALRAACPELPVAATLTEVNLNAYIAPVSASRLLIARDSDSASAQAADRLLARCGDRALDAMVIAAEGEDFNDDLVNLGRDALGERIRQALWPRRHH